MEVVSLQVPALIQGQVDLHCHTTASDGTLAPEALVARAHERGVGLLSITEHDTLASWSEACAAADHWGVALVPGIELSCQWRGATVHVLGYDFDVMSPVIQAAVARQQDNRWQRAHEIAARLQKARLPELLEAACRHSGGDVPGRPHFARAMVEMGVVSSEAAAFRSYLGNGKPGDVKAFWPSLEEVVAWIVESGGVAMIAHPRKYDMTATRLRELIAAFRACGGAGIEVLTGGQSVGDTGFLVELARRWALPVTIGSDFHTPGQAWGELGRLPPLPEGLHQAWLQFQRIRHPQRAS